MPLWANFGNFLSLLCKKTKYKTVCALLVMNIDADGLLGYDVEPYSSAERPDHV